MKKKPPSRLNRQQVRMWALKNVQNPNVIIVEQDETTLRLSTWMSTDSWTSVPLTHRQALRVAGALISFAGEDSLTVKTPKRKARK